MSASLLEIRGLRKEFGSRCILNIPELNLEAGRGYTLAGDNGSGKTTLLRILAGLEPATFDTYKFEGRLLPLADLRGWVRHQVIYVEQVIKVFQRVIITKLYAGMKRPNFEPFFYGIFCGKNKFFLPLNENLFFQKKFHKKKGVRKKSFFKKK